MLEDGKSIERALALVGELLQARGVRRRIVIIGGAAINLLGIVSRATTDVDILAFGRPNGSLYPPDEPLPPDLAAAANTVAGDLGLDPHWLNTGPASQWRTGLPPGLPGRVQWRDFGGLAVGIVSRYDLIHFKLYAAADAPGPGSVHAQDLLALSPSDLELAAAAEWVRSQDPSPAFADALNQVIAHVHRNRA
jgi:hypothetical protein